MLCVVEDEGRMEGMERVAGVVEIDRTDDTHEVVIAFPLTKSDVNGLASIVLQPRHARYLANLLLENATYAEAEAAGRIPESRHYRRKTT